MSSLRARLALAAYRLGGIAIYPLIGPYLAVRAAKGKEESARKLERFGYASANRPQGPLIWFHAASVSARPPRSFRSAGKSGVAISM